MYIIYLARMLSKINAISHSPFEGSPIVVSNSVRVGANPTEVDIVGWIDWVNDARCIW